LSLLAFSSGVVELSALIWADQQVAVYFCDCPSILCQGTFRWGKKIGKKKKKKKKKP
jgi:hypothetical protein